MKISADSAFLGILAILGIFDGIRVLRLSVFVPEPLGSGSYLIGLSAMLLLAIIVETIRHPLPPVKAIRGRSKRLFLLYRDPEIQAWLALISYSVLLEAIGYFLSTLFYSIISIRIFGERRWVWVFAGGSALALFLYILFQKLAGIPLP